MTKKSAEALLQGLVILLADGNAYMRRLSRNMLTTLGAKSVIEAEDGVAALEAIRSRNPDVVLLDSDLPGYNGLDVARAVRTPGMFPRPHVPIIMLSGHASQAAVKEAMHAGVHEFLIKPTSPKALHDRLTSILINPRPMTRRGDFYGPEPRQRIELTKLGHPA
jgi:CheY-like chemotaxis protein